MRILIAIACVFVSLFSIAQAPTLVVEGTAPGLYIAHVVAPKESYYSLARLYNLPAGTLATFNNSNLQTGLRIGQRLKIPLTQQNFDQQGSKDASETLVPLYHVVAKNETLFRVGNNHNKVPLTAIKEWNNLANDNLEAGAALVVGHLKIKNDQLSLLGAAIPANAAPAVAAATTPAPEKPKSNTFNPSGASPAASQTPPATEPVAQSSPSTPPATEVVQQTTPAPSPVQSAPASQASTNNNDIIEKKAPTPAANNAAQPKPDLLAPSTGGTPDEGFFARVYSSDSDDKSLAENSGEAGTFKSTSGWQDKKYYVLMNNVEPGTILKVSAADKSIYAKVLGSLPDVKDDKNLLLRISNAAASYLGKIDPKFPVQVSYYR